MARVPGVINPNRLQMAPGYLQLGPANTSFDSTNLQDLGAVSGVGTIHPQATDKDIELGGPLILAESRLAKVQITLEVVLQEFSLAALVQRLGLPGTVTNNPAAGAPTTVANELKTMTGPNWFFLQNRNLTNAPVTAALQSATPVNLIENVDFKVDRPSGMVRLINSINIAADFSQSYQIAFGYSFTGLATADFTFGSGRTNIKPWYPARFTVPIDGIKFGCFGVDIYRAFVAPADAESFKGEDYTGGKIKLKGAIAYDRSPDDNVFHMWEQKWYL